MHILASEFLKCLETGRSALKVPELLSVLFSQFSIIYGLNKSLYCQSWENRTKAATVIVSRSFWGQDSSYLLGRQRSGHKLPHWTVNLTCALARQRAAGRRPGWMQGCVIPIHSSPHTGVSSQGFPNLTFPPPSPRYSMLELSAVSTLLPVINDPLCTYYHFSCWLAKLLCTCRFFCWIC